MLLKMNEVFYSIQGEGAKAGSAAVFLRFAGCNLSCPWCDTNHAENFVSSATDLSKRVEKYPKGAMVVLTGGEPMIQARDAFLNLLDCLEFNERFIAMETNGTLYDPEVIKALDWVTVSPKIGSEVAIPLADICELKYIMTPELSLKDVPEKFKGFIYLQPLSTDEASTLRCIDWVQKFPKRFTLSIQMHKYINVR